MVKKLIKYDFRSYLRLLLPVQLILIGIAAINRFIQLFEPASSDALTTQAVNAYSIIFNSSLALYFVSIAVCLLMTVIVAVIRFYQGMYTNEGYLNHTLPVKPSQHITAKLLISLIFDLGTLLAIFLSFMVITLGDVNIEVFKAFGYLVGKFFAKYGAVAVVYIIEAVLALLTAQLLIYLKLYFCISVGQLAKKKKILLAFGVFFGIYIVNQIIGTIFIVCITLNMEWFSDFITWLAEKDATAHVFLCGYIVFYAIFSLVYFLITKYIMGKKLNLS